RADGRAEAARLDPGDMALLGVEDHGHVVSRAAAAAGDLRDRLARVGRELGVTLERLEGRVEAQHVVLQRALAQLVRERAAPGLLLARARKIGEEYAAGGEHVAAQRLAGFAHARRRERALRIADQRLELGRAQAHA